MITCKSDLVKSRFRFLNEKDAVYFVEKCLSLGCFMTDFDEDIFRSFDGFKAYSIEFICVNKDGKIFFRSPRNIELRSGDGTYPLDYKSISILDFNDEIVYQKAEGSFYRLCKLVLKGELYRECCDGAFKEVSDKYELRQLLKNHSALRRLEVSGLRKIRFKELQRLIGMSNSELAKWLEVDGRSITRWRGNQDAPKAVILAMKYRAKYGEI